ncbi:MAG: sterol desaturase family protein [Caulobacterales bacterium]|jgi:sterol desaturase/sphingolipid hydroxylase (fatty acid hydroxylase superfamily)
METLLRDPRFLGVVAVFIVAEFVWRKARGRAYDTAGAAASLGVAAGNFVLKPFNALIIAGAFAACHALTPLRLAVDDWRVWVVGFFAVEFCYYWFHRWSHLVRWLWASHAVHHSAQEMTFPAAIRLGWTGAFSGGWVVFVPLVLLGFPPLMIGALLAANLAYQFFLHTETVGRLGPLEWFLNTPSHHRVHHASEQAFLDKNFGGVLIIFDRLFGTFAAEPSRRRLTYGLTTGMNSRNPFWIALHEWAAIFKDAAQVKDGRSLWQALFGRPGAFAKGVGPDPAGPAPHPHTTPSAPLA